MVFPKMPEKIHPSPFRHAYVGENEIDGGFFEKSERHFHRGRHPDPEMVSAKNFRQQVEGHGVVLDHKDRLSGNIAFGNQTDIRTFFSARVHSPHYQKEDGCSSPGRNLPTRTRRRCHGFRLPLVAGKKDDHLSPRSASKMNGPPHILCDLLADGKPQPRSGGFGR